MTNLLSWGRRCAPGILLSALVAAIAERLAALQAVSSMGLSLLPLAIVLGMLIGNTVYPQWARHTDPGVTFSRQRILRLGVVLYGLRLTFQDIALVGWGGVILDALIVGLSFAIAVFVGVKLLKLDKQLAMMIGSGASICGAAAVLATEPVVKAKAEHVAVAVATVVVFGTIAMFLYPVFYTFNLTLGSAAILPTGVERFGIYIGATVHEVAQVIVASRAVGEAAADVAVITKMVRVMMLAPFLIVLSAYLSRDTAADGKGKVVIPWFALGFIGVVAFNSWVSIPPTLKKTLLDIDLFLLGMAMAALGMATRISEIRKAGLKPLVLAFVLFVWLVLGGALLSAWVL